MTQFARQLACLLLLGGLAAWGQQATAAPVAATYVPSDYLVGSNDVLSMRVAADPTLDTQGVVDHDGNFELRSGTMVNVAGKTLREIDKALADALIKDGMLLPPAVVSTTVMLVESKQVMVTGAVRQMVTWQAVQPISVLEVLGKAGGPTDATSEIEVVKRGDSGKEHLVYDGSYTALVRAPLDAVPMLTGGETVKVLAGGTFYVAGEVNHPGRFPLDDTDPITVTKAFVLAGQFTKVAKPEEAVLIHNDGSGDPIRVTINMQAILDGKAPDVRLAANDYLVVPRSGEKAAVNTATSIGLQIFSVVTAGLLISHP